MAKDSFSPLDAEKVQFCQSCRLTTCNPYGVNCPFNVKYGRYNDPKTFMQRICGFPERGEDFGDIADKIKYAKRSANA